MMTERRERVLRLYHSALAYPPAGREAFLSHACAADDELRREVEALLAQDPPSGFLVDEPSSAVTASSFTEPLRPGQRVGVFQVGSRLGSGGMGEVFRARDTRLGRDVALKVLPPLVGRDPERLARLEGEAQILATLNHPHIASIYGVEDSHGSPALVLELVEGETLFERLARLKATSRAGLPVAEAVAIARQIADALDAAHDKGIVHRDLKPANIKFAADGTVKVLDFGLARAMGDDGEPVSASRDRTRTGMALGTVPYMSPEQARGERVDKRADIWAFGCVFYEMLTGRAAFAQATPVDTVAAILHQEPDWTALPAETTPAIRLLLERCLHKDARARLRDISGAQLTLDAASSRSVPDTVPPAKPARTIRQGGWTRAAVVVLALLAGGLLAGLVMSRELDSPPRVTRLSIAARGDAALHIGGNDRELTITPDGSRVVYVGNEGRTLFVRALDQLAPVAIVTGSLLRNPFVSPDGQWVGYNDLAGPGPLWKVPISGGPPVRLTTQGVGILRGAVWLPDNTIVFGSSFRGNGLQRVSADGGTPQVLTTPDAARGEYDHYWPEALPDGRGVLYTILSRTGGLDAARIAVHDLQTNTSTDLLSGGSHATYLQSGHLAYVAGGTLWSVPFDAGRRTVAGTAVPVLNQLYTSGTGGGNFAVSATGTLAYAHNAGYDPFARTLSWIDRNGMIEPLDAQEHGYAQPRLSHDGTRIVYAGGVTPENNPWLLDIARGTPTRLRREAAREQQPSWSPDDHWILFASDRNAGRLQIWRQAADGTGEPELLVESGSYPIMTPDGTRLIFAATPTPGNVDIMQMALDGSSRAEPLVAGPFTENGPEVSPDGRWLAYRSNRSGQDEIYVSPYPDVAAGRWVVSTGGGLAARWARSSKELFFTATDGALMGVQVKAAGQAWAASAPVKVLEPGFWSRDAPVGPGFDVSLDGRRFLVVTPSRHLGDPPDLVVIQHWDQELEERVRKKYK